MKRDAVDVEEVRRATLIAATLFKDAQDVSTLDFVEALAVGGGPGRAAS
jgi:hypothetical protein